MMRVEIILSERINRRGVSLLEVILSLAILGGSLAALSSIVMTGADAAAEAREMATAQMLCEQQLAQVMLNTSVSPTSFADQNLPSLDPNSVNTATLTVQPAPLNGLLVLTMTVSVGPTDQSRPPTQITMTRWMLDPMLGLEQLEAEEQAAAEEAAAAGSGSGTESTSQPAAPPAGGAAP